MIKQINVYASKPDNDKTKFVQCTLTYTMAQWGHKNVGSYGFFLFTFIRQIAN